MHLATFRSGSGQWQVGVVRDGAIQAVDGFSGPTGMLDLIRGGSAGDAANRVTGPKLQLDQVHLGAPIPIPFANIICLGRNYASHAAEMAGAGHTNPSKPTFFTKAVTTVIGPHDNIPYDPDISTSIDWELELAFVVGRRAFQVPEDEALKYVFGYSVLNDVSARDIQYGYGGQYFLGKSLNGSCPMGPWIVTADEIPDPQTLNLHLEVNGQTKQQDNTRNMIFSVARTIADLSHVLTLEPGQIVATGTPAGVGDARDPKEYLRPGDVVKSTVVEIGSLENRLG